MLQQGAVVAIFGKAGGTVVRAGRLEAANHWEAPVAGQVIVGDSGVAVWQVFADNKPVRQIMARFAKTGEL